MSKDNSYFEPSKKDFIINYSVENIEQIIADMKTSGLENLDEIESNEYGKFVDLLDPEGNKIELWEPVDEAFTNPPKRKTNL